VRLFHRSICILSNSNCYVNIVHAYSKISVKYLVGIIYKILIIIDIALVHVHVYLQYNLRSSYYSYMHIIDHNLLVELMHKNYYTLCVY